MSPKVAHLINIVLQLEPLKSGARVCRPKYYAAPPAQCHLSLKKNSDSNNTKHPSSYIRLAKIKSPVDNCPDCEETHGPACRWWECKLEQPSGGRWALALINL